MLLRGLFIFNTIDPTGLAGEKPALKRQNARRSSLGKSSQASKESSSAKGLHVSGSALSRRKSAHAGGLQAVAEAKVMAGSVDAGKTGVRAEAAGAQVDAKVGLENGLIEATASASGLTAEGVAGHAGDGHGSSSTGFYGEVSLAKGEVVRLG